MLYLHPGPDSVLWSQVCKVRYLGWWNQVQVHLPKPPYEWGLPTWPSHPIGSHTAEHLGHGCPVVISCRQRACRQHRPQSWAQRQREKNPVPHASGSRRRYICSYVVPFHSVLAHSQFRVKDSQGVSNHADNPLFVMSPMSLWMSPMMPSPIFHRRHHPPHQYLRYRLWGTCPYEAGLAIGRPPGTLPRKQKYQDRMINCDQGYEVTNVGLRQRILGKNYSAQEDWGENPWRGHLQTNNTYIIKHKW